MTNEIKEFIEEKINEFDRKRGELEDEINDATTYVFKPDWLTDFISSAISFGIKQEAGERCDKCSTYRKFANTGATYLCNHFSEFCDECIDWRDNE